MNLTTEEWRLINDNSTKLVRRIVAPDHSTELAELVFKIAARVKVSVRRIRFGLAGGCPDKDVFAAVWKNLQAWPS